MTKYWLILFTVLLTVILSPAVVGAQEPVGRVLQLINQWRTSHPFVAMHSVVDSGKMKAEGDYYYADKQWVLVNAYKKPVKFDFFLFPSGSNDIAAYFPLSNVSVPFPNGIEKNIIELSDWGHDITLQRIKECGGSVDLISGSPPYMLRLTFSKKYGTTTNAIITSLSYKIDSDGKITSYELDSGDRKAVTTVEFLPLSHEEITQHLLLTMVRRPVEAEISYTDALHKEYLLAFKTADNNQN